MTTNQAQSLNHNSLERFGFSDHETFPFRYGWLKKAVDAATKNKFLFSSEQALVELGVGKNMVQGIRHWGLATHRHWLAQKPGLRHRADWLGSL